MIRFFQMAAAAVIALSMTVGLAPGGAGAAEMDRLRGVVEPVKAKKPYRVGVALVHFIDDYWKGVAYGILDEAKEAGVEIVRVLGAGGYGKLPEQIANLEQLASLNVDAIIHGPVSYDGFDKTIERITQKGIKVIMADIPINSKHPAILVGQDQWAIGAAMAKYVCAEGPGAKVATIPGPAGAEWNRIRFEGFKAGAKECGLELLGNTYQKATALEDGHSQASDLVIKYPEAEFLYTAAGHLGTGAAMAVKQLNRKVRIVGSGIVERVPELIKSGDIDMYVSEPAILIGRLELQYAVRLLNGDPLPGIGETEGIQYPRFFIPPFSVTAETLKTYDLSKYDMPPKGWQPPASQ
jgi:ABC-type sugar transport system substrate-binding protein